MSTRKELLTELLAREEEDGVPRWHYLSFSKQNGDGDWKFAGACLVHAFGPLDAMRQAHLLNINPGGTVAMCDVSDAQMECIPDECKHRLMSFEEMERWGLHPRRMEIEHGDSDA